MALILSIDTSTTVCSVALHQDGNLLAAYELLAEKSSSGMLTTLIRDAVQHTGHQLPDLDAVAVAKGPGSYTGLRIGVSTAKGLCFALDKPMIAINTLEAMARQMGAFYSPAHGLCPMIDARRMEVYSAVYMTDGQEIEATAATIVDEHSFAEVLAQRPVVFFGNGAAKCKPVLSHQENAIFPERLIHPSARTIGELAALAYADTKFENVALFEPFYLKDFVGTKPRKAIVQ
ncbi:tRNA (adenosine(37)-N6)-threonylcarbamoyltransferase complex dimerization subunit type 1 TsaB [Tellurirhabdus bombi]|uniref:tRNA (adenosine(37)-N6)-threonylcarbamoyltransferase complex dimerization subunit type 1 TsaB n=1 Tax=Tellurirhabdus bombi TaxID=2907205 RepID=UPI001F304CDF|nr:tRNA (adenosine(37)-N6)-threonylcarbamoyltransferase complex dimerization subunit type 1 TsaB [Tellurirhabdus bombi]